MSHEKEQAILEDARTMANIAVWSVELQIQRITSQKLDIPDFVMQPIIDFHFLVTALSRLKNSAELASKVIDITDGIRQFDLSLPDLRKVRNVLEHIDEYREGKGRNKEVARNAILTINFEGQHIHWLGYKINIEEAMSASQLLYSAISEKSPN